MRILYFFPPSEISPLEDRMADATANAGRFFSSGRIWRPMRPLHHFLRHSVQRSECLCSIPREVGAEGGGAGPGRPTQPGWRASPSCSSSRTTRSSARASWRTSTTSSTRANRQRQLSSPQPVMHAFPLECHHNNLVLSFSFSFFVRPFLRAAVRRELWQSMQHTFFDIKNSLMHEFP